MQSLIDEYRLPISVEDGLDFVALQEKKYLKRGIDLKAGARDLITYLKRKQFKILLASSSTMERAFCILSSNGIEDYFDYMVFGTEVKRGKPFPDIFF